MGLDLTGIGSIANLAGSIINKIWPPSADPNKKVEAQLELQRMLETRETALIAAQREIMVAEMQQADPYTKRARPTIVYAGLIFIFLVHVAFPLISWWKSMVLPALALPEEFWWTWGGVCGVWILGRSMEKRGIGGAITSVITGGK